MDKINNYRMAYYRNSSRYGQSRYQSSSTGQHLLGMETILNKYQNENKILTNQIAKLIEENKNLKCTDPRPDSRHKYQNIVQRERQNQIHALREKWSNSLSQGSSKNYLYEKRGIVEGKKPDYKYNWKREQEDGVKTIRKNERFSIQKRKQSPKTIQKLQLFPQKIKELPKQHQRIKTQPQPPFEKQITCAVYLEEDTFDIVIEQKHKNMQVQSYQEPSFGNTEFVAPQKSSKIDKDRYIFIDESIEEEVSKIAEIKPIKEKANLTEIKLSNQIEGNNHEELSESQVKHEKNNFSKKNNSPYIGYKLGEPKTQLKKIFPSKENRTIVTNSSIPKKSYLSIMSKSLIK